MNKENKNTPTYEPPKMEMFELMPEGVLCMSGQGTDTNNDYDFGERF